MQTWKPGNMLYPLPAVMVSCADGKGNSNIITVAWAGTVCSDPAMVSISVRPERYSYAMIKETGEFVINLTTAKLARAMDLAGVRSGREINKWESCRLTPEKASRVSVPLIAESPVHIECRVRQVIPLGSHDLFLADVLCVDVDEQYMDENGFFDLNAAGLLAYSHGKYYALGEQLGKFGYSVQKKRGPGKKRPKTEKQTKKDQPFG